MMSACIVYHVLLVLGVRHQESIINIRTIASFLMTWDELVCL